MAQGLSQMDFTVDEVQCSEDWSESCFIINLGSEYFTPVVEEEISTPAPSGVEEKAKSKSDLERGLAYLVENDDPDSAYKLFRDELGSGSQGLCITRDFPNKVRRVYGLSQTPILWLSNAEQEFAVEPVQLGKLYHKIEDFLKKADQACVMISGLEYLIVQNNYHSALKFLQLVRDQVAIYDSLLIATISPETLSDKDLKLIEREMTPLALGDD
jgi:hypothetical protein